MGLSNLGFVERRRMRPFGDVSRCELRIVPLNWTGSATRPLELFDPRRVKDLTSPAITLEDPPTRSDCIFRIAAK